MLTTTLSQWIAAVGTAGATLLAAAALAIQQRDRRRQVAEQITAWLQMGEQEPITFHVLNSSTVAAYEVIARAVFRKTTTQAVTAFPVLPPGEQTNTVEELWDPDHLDAVYAPGVSLKFRDSAGRAWHRTIDGRIKRLRRRYSEYEEYMKALDEVPREDPEGSH